MTVQDVDRGWKRIKSQVEILNRMGVKVGIQADETSSKGFDLASIAAVQEFGEPSLNIPARPFVRVTADRTVDALPALLERLYGRVLDGTSGADLALATLGTWYQAQMQDTIRQYPWLPNAPRTTRKKKSSKPLIDTGRLLTSIRWKSVVV